MGGSKNKSGYFDKLQALLEEYKSVFIVEIDNVSSQQMHEIRQSLRGQGVVLMGKNTMVSSTDSINRRASIDRALAEPRAN
jgi:large subunit ribosomal protein LP0